MFFAAFCGVFSVCAADNNTGFIPGDLETIAQTGKAQPAKTKYELSDRLKKPYISTYYVKPIISPEEDAVIRFYVTDWYQSGYRCGDYSHKFKVAVSYANAQKVTIKATKYLENLQEGDHEINLGKLPAGVYTLTLQCMDSFGRLSHLLYQEFCVRSESAGNIPPEKTYQVTAEDLRHYGIRNDGDLGKLFLVDTSDIDPKDEKRKEKIKARLEEAAAKKGKPSSGHYYIFAHSSKPGMTDFRNYENCKIVYASDYSKTAVENQARKTAAGLQKLMDEKAKQGFRKIVFQKGTYRISSEYTLRPPSWMTIDLNGATVKLNAFTGDKGLMMELCDTMDSHVINGTVEGDYFEHDYANSPNKSEWVCGISISGHAKYSSFENIHLKYITGYGSTNGISNVNGKGFTFTPSLEVNGFQPGDINRKTGAFVRVQDSCISKMIPLEKLGSVRDFSVSKYLGYQGRVSDSWYVTVHFFDVNKRYICSVEAYQYRFLRKPPQAAYACVAVSGNDPEELNKAGLKINTFRIPWNCAYKKIIHENCRAVGMAQSAMRNFLVEDCEFFRCGENLAKCAYDAEDGWDQMQDIYIHNNYFHDNFINDFLTCAGHNFVIEGNRGNIHLWDRTNSSCVRNNTGKTGTFYVNGHSRTQFLRLENNHFTEKISVGRGGDEKKPSDWYTVLRGEINAAYIETGHNARLFQAMVKDKKLGTVTAQDSALEKCSVNFSDSVFHNCTLTDVTGQLNANAVFSQCKMNRVSGSTGLPMRLNILNCELTDTSFFLNYWTKPCEIYVENTTVKNEKLPLIKTPGYSVKNFIFTGLKANTGSEPLVLIYDLRKQPADNEPGAITVVKSEIANTANKIIGISDKSKTEKKVTLTFRENHTEPDTMELAGVLKNASMPESWSVKTE